MSVSSSQKFNITCSTFMQRNLEMAGKDKKDTPPKSKTNDESANCSTCSIVYSKKDQGRHKSWCSEIVGDRSEQLFSSANRIIPEKSIHGFVHDRCHLFGNVIREFAVPKELQSLANTRLRDRFVFVNPRTMRDCSMKIGDHAAITIVWNETDQRRSTTAVVWPSSKIAQFAVGIPKSSTFDGDFSISDKTSSYYCLVSKIRDLKRASQIRLVPTASTRKSRRTDDFVRSCQAYLKGSCLRSPNDFVRIPYYGQIHEFETIAVNVDDRLVDGDELEASNRSLIEKMSTLDLTANADGSTSDISISKTSTPIRNGTTTPTISRSGTPASTPGTPVCNPSSSSVRLPRIDPARDQYVLLDESTEVILDDNATDDHTDQYRPKIDYSMLGGMARTKELLVDHVSVCLREKIDGSVAMKSILLYGLTGCGKTSLAEAVAAEVGANFLRLDSSITSEDGAAESKLEHGFADLDGAFRTAEQHQPCVVLLDDLESISDKAKKNLNSIATWMEKLDKNSVRVCAIGTSSAIERVNAGLRKRFQFEIEVPVPTAADRKRILEKMLGNRGEITEQHVESLADRTHGFTPSDLNILLKEAVVVAHKRLKSMSPSSESPLRVEFTDLQSALTSVRPSAMREIFVEVPKVRWTDVGGNEEIKLKLQQAVEWPLQHPEKFAQLGIKPPTGILMYGPPGCSKTMIAKALATESGLNFLSVKGPELFSKWVGESERAVRDLFRKARQVAPSVIFFDEIDAIGSERSGGGGGGGSSSNVNERVLAQMLTEMDGIQPLTNVTIVAATNRPDVIDRALLRPGRLDISIYVRLPDQRTREQILRLELGKKRIAEDVVVEDLMTRTDRYTGAELVALCNEAGLAALSESRSIEAIWRRHFDKALNVIKPRISDESLKVFERFERSVTI